MKKIVNHLIRIIEDYSLTTIRAFSHDRPEGVPIKVADDSIPIKPPCRTKDL